MNINRLRNIAAAGSRGAQILFICVLVISVITGSVFNIILNGRVYEQAVKLLNEERIIIIDAGHGGEDPGAISRGGVYEKDLNFAIATELGAILNDNGFAVVYTRCDDKLLYREEENIKGIKKISDLKNRCKIGAEYPNALFVSIHMNSFGDPKYSGLQVYFGLKDQSSRMLADMIQTSVTSRLQAENKRAIKRGDGLYLLEHLENPAVIIECGFMSNDQEIIKLCEKEYQKALSFSIFYGILEYNEKYS